MADNAQEYAEIAVRSTIQVTESFADYTGFLTAERNAEPYRRPLPRDKKRRPGYGRER